MRSNFYNVQSVQQIVPHKDLSTTTRYLVSSPNLFLGNEDKEALFKERSLATTPISKMYARYVDEKVYDQFSLIAIPSRQSLHLPECLTQRVAVVDMLQAKDSDPSIKNSVSVTRTLDNKLLCNVTQLTSTDGRYYYLKDHDSFQSMIVKNCLTRSYFTQRHSANWLRPSIATTLAKVYALLISSNLARIGDLDQASQDYVTIVFAAYFFGQVCDERGALGLIQAKSREFYIRDRSIVVEILKDFNEKLGKALPETLEDCFLLTNSLGITRFQIGRRVLIDRFRTIGGDILTTSIALEYAPYFVWSVLNAMSGAKNQLNIFIKNQRLVKDVTLAIGELLQSLPRIV